MIVQIETAELRYDYGNSNKFWRYYIISPTHWVAHWGRVSSEGQYKVMLQSAKGPSDVYREKIHKGYRVTISNFAFPAADHEVEDWTKSLALGNLGAMFAKNRPKGAAQLSVPSRPTVTVRKMSAIEKQLDSLMKATEQ